MSKPNSVTGSDLLESIIADSSIEARDYQKRLVDKSTGFFNGPVKNLIVESPTGSGKTCMALLITKMMQKQHNIGIGWTTMRRNLLRQAAAENKDLGINVNDVEFISVFDKNPPTHDKAGRKIELLVHDEAQHDAANSSMNIHNTVKPRWVLGMTATPFRQDKMRLCFDKSIRDIGIRELIQMGYLSKYHQYTLKQYNPTTVSQRYIAEQEKWGKSIMFWHKAHEARECMSLLEQGGVRAEFLLGSDSTAEQERKLAAIENGSIDVLLNLFKLTEGFDCPSLKTAWVRPSGKGPTMQMAGRVFRMFDQFPHKQIVQCQQTRWPITRTATPDEQYAWSDEQNGWVSLKMNKNISRIISKSFRAIAQNDAQLPAYLQKHGAKANPFAALNTPGQ